jgi:hypothetical protein
MAVRRVVIGGLIAALVLLAPPVLFVAAGQRPSDQHMINLLSRRTTEFERLVEMCREDELVATEYATYKDSYVFPVHAWRADLSRPDPAREREYRRLLRRTGVSAVACSDEAARLRYRSFGLSISGWRKDFVYISAPGDMRLLPSLDSVDAIWEGQYGFAEAYRDVGDGWFLYYLGN